jgi:phospholipase C
MAGTPTRAQALDHVVVVLFKNRSLDNVLGRLYGPDDKKTFDGVVGKDLSNPIPEWAEHGADRKVVPYSIATDMDAPNPDSGEEHTTRASCIRRLGRYSPLSCGMKSPRL